MLYIIAYDIPSDRRRTKVHNTLSGVGQWTQYSLFECHLSEKERIVLQDKLDKIVEPEEDSIRFYPLCASCMAKVETVGSPEPEEQTLFVV